MALTFQKTEQQASLTPHITCETCHFCLSWTVVGKARRLTCHLCNARKIIDNLLEEVKRLNTTNRKLASENDALEQAVVELGQT